MKNFGVWIAAGLVVLAAGSVAVDDAVAADEGSEGKEELITRSYWFPADLYEYFSTPSWKDDPRHCLERCGVTFGSGAKAGLVLGEPGKDLRNLEGRHQLIVRNTSDQHELVEAFVRSLEEFPYERQVATIVEVIEMDRSTYHRWQWENSLEDTGDALRRFVQKEIRSGDAETLETLALTARSGSAASAVSASLQLYPTGATPPSIPEILKLDGADAELQSVPSSPTRWAQNEVGQRLEIKPVIRENNRDVNVTVSVTLTGDDESKKTVWPSEEVPDHERREIPTFDTRQVTTNVTVTDCGYALIGAWKPTGEDADKNRVQLAFVRTDIMAIPR